MPNGPDDRIVLPKQLPTVGMPEDLTPKWYATNSQQGTFGPAVALGPRLKGFWLSDIKKFLANLPPAGQPLPVLWPPQPKRANHMAPAMQYGRKPGGKVITDPVTGKRRYVLPERRLITRPTRRDPPDDLPALSTEAAQ